ncbi:hypothetical protein F511_14696 [Dorcoceras hygrometricum]|uniref:Uncharacterized protein n=1 Tax=Dorcoceras hygrometricum TaxID=472368 RepID=A0A2Z7AZR2_9LAMI|nr:hypothetical protein F511_14696 [Dorcoceras hygrometricum]
MRIRPSEVETSICDAKYHVSLPPQASHGRPSTSPQPHGHAPPPRHHAPPPHDRTCSDRRAEVIPSVANPPSLLLQIDGGRLILVVDLIGGSTVAYREEPNFPCEFKVGARRLDASKKSPPKEAPTDISPEELVTLQQWWDDELKTRCYVMASMSC